MPSPEPYDDTRDTTRIARALAPESSVPPEGSGRIPIAREGEGGAMAGGVDWTGKYIGPYRVQKPLSKGGMGVVLLAWDEALRRAVALKVMEQHLLQDGDALKRFEREARASAAIQHRNIAQIYLVGLSESGLPFLAMEYIEGGSLMDAIRQRRALSFSEVAALMEQVGSALQAASRLNIIHRDIKPANIMLTKDLEARVVDFGLAKIFFEDSYMTQEGMVLGTPSYMAPEQSQGRVVDHRADIYSFGATFYHLITGRAPFTGDSPVQIMMKHVTAPLIPMRSQNPAVPVEFDEIVGRCMRKDVNERYQDYETLLVDIKRVRLMCHSRERGGVIGGDGRPHGGHPQAVASSLMPAPPPKSGFNELPPFESQMPSPPPSVRVRHAAGVTQLSDVPAEQTGWSMTQLAIMGGAGVVLLVAVVAMFLMPGSATEETEDGAPRKKAAIAVLLDKATQTAEGTQTLGGQVTPDDYKAYVKTVDILASLHAGILAHHSQMQELPATLAEVATESRVIVNFKKSDDGEPLDGWGEPLVYDPESGDLRSAGLDQNFFSSDDLLHPFSGEAIIPEVYSRLEVKSR